jgi:hypothetical protein
MNTIWLGLSAVILAGAVAQAGETIEQRAPNGKRTGELHQEGSRLVERDVNGNARSYYIQQGGHTEHRTMDGRLLGTSDRR